MANDQKFDTAGPKPTRKKGNLRQRAYERRSPLLPRYSSYACSRMKLRLTVLRSNHRTWVYFPALSWLSPTCRGM